LTGYLRRAALARAPRFRGVGEVKRSCARRGVGAGPALSGGWARPHRPRAHVEEAREEEQRA